MFDNSDGSTLVSERIQHGCLLFLCKNGLIVSFRHLHEKKNTYLSFFYDWCPAYGVDILCLGIYFEDLLPIVQNS